MNVTLAEQAITLRLLSHILLEIPTKMQLKSLIDSGVFREIPFAQDQPAVKKGLEFMTRWLAQDPMNQVEEVRQDAMALFVGPARPLASPWESIYRNKDHLLFQEETLQVRALYRKFSLESKQMHREPDDHIALEMEFLAVLLERANVLSEKEDDTTELMQGICIFLKHHLGLWYEEWCNQVIQYAKTDFYAGMGYLVKGVLHELVKCYL